MNLDIDLPPSNAERLALLRMTKPSFERAANGKVSDAERDFVQSALLTHIPLGLAPTAVCGALNISWSLVKSWAKADADFDDKLKCACEQGNESLADGLLTVHEKHINPAMAKVEADNTRWLLGVRDRSTYGTKVEVTDTGSAGLVDVLKAAIARIPRPQAQIEAPVLDLKACDPDEAIDIDELFS